MSASVFKVNGTGAAAIATSLTVPAGQTYQLVSVTCNLNAESTTSENVTITLNAHAGAAYDLLLYTLDLSVGDTTDLLWQPDEPVYLEGGDAVDVAWFNTERRTYGVQITAQEVD